MIPLGVLASGYVAPAGGWSPSDLDGLALWLDADDDSTITESSGAVSEWGNKGSGPDVTQSIAAYKPTTGAASINSLNAITFDGTNDCLSAASSFTSAAQPYLMAVVINVASTEKNANIIDFASPRSLIGWGKSGLRMYAGSISDGGTMAAGLRLYVAVFNGTSSSLRIDGSQNRTASPGSSSFGGSLTVMCGKDGGYWGGDVGEIIVAADTSQTSSLEDYLMTKWGIS